MHRLLPPAPPPACAAAKELTHAARDIGVFYLTDHGIPQVGAAVPLTSWLRGGGWAGGGLPPGRWEVIPPVAARRQHPAGIRQRARVLHRSPAAHPPQQPIPGPPFHPPGSRPPICPQCNTRYLMPPFPTQPPQPTPINHNVTGGDRRRLCHRAQVPGPAPGLEAAGTCDKERLITPLGVG